MAQNWWEQDEQVAPQGGGVVTRAGDPTIPFRTTQERNQAAASAYDPAKAEAEARLAEAQARIAEAEASRAGAMKAAELNQQADYATRRETLDALESQIRATEQAWERSLKGGVPNWIAGRIPTSGVGEFNTLGSQLLDVGQSVFRIPGSGDQSERELQSKIEALKPVSTDTDAQIRAKLDYMKRRVDEQREALGLPRTDWDYGGEDLLPGMDRTRQTVTDVGAGQRQPTLATGETQRVEDPMLRKIAGQVGRMVSSGQSDEAIRNFLSKAGVDPATTNIEGVLEYRRSDPRYKEWKRLNPNKPYPVGEDFYMREVPMSETRQLYNELSQSPLGAFAVQAGQGVTGNRLDNLAGLLGGDPEQVRLGTELLREEQPMASLAGDIAGQAMFEYAAGRVPGAQALRGVRGARMGADAAYGAYSGSGMGEDMFDASGAVTGSVANVAGGAVGRGATNMASTALRGVQDETLKYLNDQGVDLTIGEIARATDSLPGRIVAWTEDRMAGLPGADALVNTARYRGAESFNRAAMRQAGEPIGATVTETGERGLGQLKEATIKEYQRILNPIRVAKDQGFVTAVAGVRRAAKGIPEHGKKVDYTIARVENMFKNNMLTGRRLQDAVRTLRKEKANYAGQPLGDEAIAALQRTEDELFAMVGRQASPDVVTALDAVNRAHGNRKIVQRAASSMSAQRNDGLMSPQQLNQASIQNTRKFGGDDLAMSENRPFYQLTTSAMDAMGQTIPDSGTAGRTALVPLLGATVAGGSAALGASTDNPYADAASGFGTGLGLLSLAAAPVYSRAGQRAIQQALLADRPYIDAVERLIQNNPTVARALGLLNYFPNASQIGGGIGRAVMGPSPE